MRKLALFALLAAALAVPSIAAAASPQGQLTGSADFGSGQTFAVGTTVVDGGTSYVGLENDRSGNCDGDSGTIAGVGTVVCAHFVLHSRGFNAGSPKMRVAYENGMPGQYLIARITDNGPLSEAGVSPDSFALVFANGTPVVFSLAQARAWVNMGLIGGGGGGFWFFAPMPFVSGDFTVTP